MFRVIIMAFVAAFSFLASADPGHAQATRTWVSGVGDDANPCSRTAPCKTFAGAISKTATNGEINVLDPGGFGALTITKSISIIAEGQEAGVLAAGTNGININSATANVRLIGLDFEGFGTGFSGIKVFAAASVHIDKCRINGFKADSGSLPFGIDVKNTGATKVYITNTTVTNNLRGIGVTPAAGGTAEVFVDHVTVQGNTTGIRTDVGSTLWLNNSTVTQNFFGARIFAGVANSFRNNVISGNGSNIPDNALTPANLQ